MNLHHGMNLPAGIKTRRHMKAKYTGGTCPGCAGRIIRGDEIVVDTTFAGEKATRHDAAACEVTPAQQGEADRWADAIWGSEATHAARYADQF